MSEYKMLVSQGFMELFDALVQDQYRPTPETKARLAELDMQNTADLNRWQAEKEIYFVNLWGTELFDFVKSISKGYFLVGQDQYSHFSWSIKSDDNDNYWSVRLWDGKFDYVIDICGGYAGTEILEENISKERVLELLNSKK